MDTEEKEQIKEEQKVEKERAKRAKKLLNAVAKAERGFFKDFKVFVSKGNVVQLAVAFIMGAAFKAIVDSLVGDIFMPLFGLIFGESNIENWHWKNVYYGKFLAAIISFLLISLVLFFMIKLMSKAESGIKKIRKNGTPVPPPPPPVLSKTEQLLTDIKQLLEKQEK